jgi:hypothetical protein
MEAFYHPIKAPYNKRVNGGQVSPSRRRFEVLSLNSTFCQNINAGLPVKRKVVITIKKIIKSNGFWIPGLL